MASARQKSARKIIQQLQSISIILLGLVLLVVLYDLALRMWYEIRGPFTWDTPIYWAVGRGMLNGLVPYRDLFETKPPGIYVLSALSIAFTKGPFLGHLLQTISIPAYPITLGLLAWKQCKNQKADRTLTILSILIAVIGGGLFSLFITERSGEFQVESFGALFALFYVATVYDASKVNLRHVLLASVFLFCGIGFKEPFLLTMSAAALILYADSPRGLLRALVLPLLIAGCAGFLVMFVLGYLEPYFTIYLPEILGNEINGAGSMWGNMRAWKNIFADLQQYIAPLAFAVAGLIIVFLQRPLPKRNRRDAFIIRFTFLFLAYYLTVTAVALKGFYYNHHFVFAAPLYIALFVMLLRAIFDRRKNILLYLPISTTVVLLMTAAFLQPRYNYEERLSGLIAAAEEPMRAAQAIDAILTACNTDRYLFLGGNGPQPYGYTEHSPLGPIFFQLHHFVEESSEHLRETFIKNLETTPIIVRNGGAFADLQPFVDQYLATHFTSEPVPCAQHVYPLQVSTYEVLYRKSL